MIDAIQLKVVQACNSILLRCLTHCLGCFFDGSCPLGLADVPATHWISIDNMIITDVCVVIADLIAFHYSRKNQTIVYVISCFVISCHLMRAGFILCPLNLHAHCWHGVCPCVPRVIRKQKFAAIFQFFHFEMNRTAVAIPFRYLGFLQYVMFFRQVTQQQHHVFIVIKSKHAIVVRGASGNRIFANLIIICIGFIQRKFRIGNRLSILVRFFNLAFQYGIKVELHIHIRSGIAAFQIEELHRMIGIVGKSAAVPITGVAAFSCCFKSGFKGSVCIIVAGFTSIVLAIVVEIVVYVNAAGMKINFYRDSIVNPAKIGDKNIINEYPYVVISCKGIGDRHRILIGALRRNAILWLLEARHHIDAKIMLDGGIVTGQR